MGIVRLTLLFLGSLVALYWIEVLTVHPDDWSDHGNVALVIIFPALFLFLAFYLNLAVVCYQWFCRRRRRMVKLCLPLLVLLMTIGLWAEWAMVGQLITALGGGPDVPQSKIYRFGWFNQYTNTLFFNFATFCMVSFLVAFGAGMAALGRGEKVPEKRTAVL